MSQLRRISRSAGFLSALSGALLLASCDRDQASEEPKPTNTVQAPRPAPVVEAPLNREQLLLAVVRAASAYAAAGDDSEVQRKLDGKRFELRVRFGCGAGGDEARGWRFDEEKRTLRLRVTPDMSKEDRVAAEIAGEQFESVEGLWLRRPWLLTASCPVVQTPAPGSAPSPPARDEPKHEPEAEPKPVAAARVGLAQFFSSDDSRTTRRQRRPYEATKVLAEGQAPSPLGYDFVISGRLRALRDRRVIYCSGASPDSAPDCIISVHIDRVWIERPDTREQIAEWSGS